MREELVGLGAAVAVARTPAVMGFLTINGTHVPEAMFQVEMGTLATDDHHRDGHMYDAIEVEVHPTADFVLSEPIELGRGAGGGESVAADAYGALTIHGVPRNVVVELEAQLVEDVIVIIGSVEIRFSDYGVEAPTSNVALSVDDVGVVELQLLLTRADTDSVPSGVVR